jgi:hypothetical protein
MNIEMHLNMITSIFQEVEYKRSVNGNFEAIFPKISDGSDLLDVLEKN